MASSDEVDEYVCAALERAYLERVDGSFAATVPDAFGVVAFGATEQGCLDDLRGRLEDWVYISRSRGLPLPVLNGIDLNSPNPSLTVDTTGQHPPAAARQIFDSEREFEEALAHRRERAKHAM